MSLGAAILLAAAFQGGAHAQLPPSPPEARRTVQSFAHCIAERSPELAASTLAQDFTTRAYRSQLDQLLRANESCFDEGRMRSSRLLLAGAIAEALLERDPVPLNVRLARAAMRPAPPARNPSDFVAICTVRSVPDDVGQLFATEPASEAEAAAAGALEAAVSLCNPSSARLEITPAGMRAILATAAFRSVGGSESNSEAGN